MGEGKSLSALLDHSGRHLQDVTALKAMSQIFFWLIGSDEPCTSTVGPRSLPST